MQILRELKHQMRVISNPEHRVALGGFRLLFIGTGQRVMKNKGWWRTRLNYYALDSSDLRQSVRLPEKKLDFTRERTELVLYSPNLTYEEYYETSCKFEDSWIVFQNSTPHDPIAHLVQENGFCIFQDAGKVVRPLIDQTSQIASQNVEARWIAQIAFLRIMTHLHQSAASTNGRRIIQPLVEIPVSNGTPFHRKTMRIIKQHLASDLSVEQLAQLLKISKSNLSHRFSVEMGETLTVLRNRLRIERAQELIRGTDKTFKEIAFEVGYEDPAYFSRLFHLKTGLSPKAFRQLVSRSLSSER